MIIECIQNARYGVECFLPNPVKVMVLEEKNESEEKLVYGG